MNSLIDYVFTTKYKNLFTTKDIKESEKIIKESEKESKDTSEVDNLKKDKISNKPNLYLK